MLDTITACSEIKKTGTHQKVHEVTVNVGTELRQDGCDTESTYHLQQKSELTKEAVLVTFGRCFVQ